jgi:hypothetical protein
MMKIVRDEFYVEDETPEQLRESLRSGTRVLVMPSSLRRNIRNRLSRMLRVLADGFGRGGNASRPHPANGQRPMGRRR